MDVENTKVTPEWLLRPASLAPPKTEQEFVDRSNEYFTQCAEMDERPTITGYALAVGLPGPTSLIRLGQRMPTLRYAISACMTAIAHGYEALIGNGNPAGPMFMLKNLPDFDPEEADGAPPIQFFNERKEVLLSMEVTGAAGQGEDFDGDPLEAYMAVLKRQGPVVQQTNKSFPFTPRQPQRERLLTIINND